MVLWSLIWTARAEEDCPAAATTAEEVLGRAAAATAAWSLVPADAAEVTRARLRAALRCTNERVDAAVAAQVFLAEGVAAHRRGDLAAAIVALQAARLADPDAQLASSVIRADPGLELLFASAERPGAPEPEELHPAAGSIATVDGVISTIRPRERPCIVQLANANGQVFWTALVEARADLPEDFPSLAARPRDVLVEAARMSRIALGAGLGAGWTASHYAEYGIYDVDEALLSLGYVDECGVLCAVHTTGWAYRRVRPQVRFEMLFSAWRYLDLGLATVWSVFTAAYDADEYVWRNIGDEEEIELLGVRRDVDDRPPWDEGNSARDARFDLSELGYVLGIGLAARLYARDHGVRPYLGFSPEYRSPFGTGRSNAVKGSRNRPWDQRYTLNGGMSYARYQPRFGGNFGIRLSAGALWPIGGNLTLGSQVSYVDADAFLTPDWDGDGLVGILAAGDDYEEALDYVPLEHTPRWGLTGDLLLRWQPYRPASRRSR